MKKISYVLTLVFLCLCWTSYSQVDSVQWQIDSLENSFHYQTGVIEFPSCKARLKVPEGFRYLDAEQSQIVLSDLWGNPADSSILGLLVPENRGVLAPNSWVFTISFDEIGFVKDDDAEDIDYDDLLKEMQGEMSDANSEREQLGYPPITLVGWASEPFYDDKTKVLHWAKELRFGSDSLSTLNYNLRVLGKDGVFVLNAVATISELNEVKPAIAPVLASVEFEKGSTYFDFNPEVDEVAAWTVGGLVAGKVLAKAGIFAVVAKFGKFIVMGLIAAATGVWNFVRRRKQTAVAAPAAPENKPEQESNG